MEVVLDEEDVSADLPPPGTIDSVSLRQACAHLVCDEPHVEGLSCLRNLIEPQEQSR